MSYLAFGVADISPHSFSLGRTFHPPPKPPFSWFAEMTVQVQVIAHASYQGPISLVVFFQFFKILNFWAVSRVKGENMAQNDKKVYLPRFISQESYIICKSFLRFFKILFFLGGRGGEE